MSEVQFRPMADDELPQFRAMMKYVFAGVPEDGLSDEERPDPLRPEWSLCAFEGERMVASSGAFPFKMRFNGATMDCAGVTGVGTDPGYRRRGLVRELMTRTLHEQHRKGVPAAILWASMGGIYQRFGYGLASNHVTYEFDPRFAGFQEDLPIEGSVRLLTREEALPALVNLYRNYAAERNLLLHRSGPLWDSLLPQQGPRKPHIAIYYDAQGQPAAYALYVTANTGTPTGTGPWQKLTLYDLVWLNIEAYRAMWEYLRGHDLVHKIIWVAAPEDDPAPGLLLEPRLLGKTTKDGVWMRVIDAKAALGARRYSLPGEISIQMVQDEICPWNEGFYRVTSSGEAVAVERCDPVGEPDLVIGPNGLSSLLSGHSSASLLARIGRAPDCRGERLPFLDAFFATAYQPTCSNEF